MLNNKKMASRRISVVSLLLIGTLKAGILQAASSGESTPVATPPARQVPNVLVWMMDDVGFAQVSSYGGLVETPNIDRVARSGLRYTNYHTAPICSAARASFLAGRMPHSVHIGGHATAARDLPGYDAHIPPSAGTIADNLHSAGYVTFAVGKWDHLPNEEAGPAGPYHQWPAGQGFDRFYGFLAADADNFHPTLVNDLTPIATPDVEDYHLSEDMADRAIRMIQSRDGSDPARPFFMYWATGAAHAPHHAPEEWLRRYRGKFDMGWDQAREAILARQVKEGIMPPGTKLATRPDVIRAWSELDLREQKLYARQMEAFAASLSYADYQFGRILDALEESGELDNTVVIVVSDNGASAEGGTYGLHDEAVLAGGSPLRVEDNLAFYDVWGGPKTYPHYANGWAVAGNTPLRYYKQVAHEGGARVPLVIAWPGGIAARGELRGQFTHVSDVAPTILDLTGVRLANMVNNVAQSPMEGHSFAATLSNPDVEDRERAQYVELYGNRGLWQGDWSLVATHRIATWDWNTSSTFDEPWELYDLAKDPGQTTDLAATYPDRVAQMDRLFDEQAGRYHVRPMHNLNDTAAENMEKARQDYIRRGGKWRYSGPVGNIPSTLAPPVNIQGFVMSATLELPKGDETGPVFAYGGQLSGIGLYLDEGRPALIFNSLQGDTATISASQPLGAGEHTIELRLDKGQAFPDHSTEYRVTINADGGVVAEKSLRFSVPRFFGISETFGVGEDAGNPVMAGYPAGTTFPGGLRDVLFDFSETGPGGVRLHD